MNEEGAISALRPFGLLLLRLFDHNLLSFLILLHFKAAFVLLALPVPLSLSRLSHFLALFRINSSSRLYIYPNTTCPPPPPIPRRSGSQVGISRSSTNRNTFPGMPSPRPIPVRKIRVIRNRRLSSSPSPLWPPATGTSSISRKGSLRATRPCKQDGAAAVLAAATTRQRALTSNEVFTASARACSLREMMWWRSGYFF